MKSKYWAMLQIVSMAAGFAIGGLYWGDSEPHSPPTKKQSTASDGGAYDNDVAIRTRPAAPEQPEIARPDDQTQPQLAIAARLRGDGEVTIVLLHEDGSPAVGVELNLTQYDSTNTTESDFDIFQENYGRASERYRAKAQDYLRYAKLVWPHELVAKTDSEGKAHVTDLWGDSCSVSLGRGDYRIRTSGGFNRYNRHMLSLGSVKYGAILEKTVYKVYPFTLTASILNGARGRLKVALGDSGVGRLQVTLGNEYTCDEYIYLGRPIKTIFEKGTYTAIVHDDNSEHLSKEVTFSVPEVDSIDITNADRAEGIRLNDKGELEPKLLVNIIQPSKFKIGYYSVVVAESLAGIEPERVIIDAKHAWGQSRQANKGTYEFSPKFIGDAIVGIIVGRKVVTYTHIYLASEGNEVEVMLEPDVNEHWVDITLNIKTTPVPSSVQLSIDNPANTMRFQQVLWRQSDTHYLLSYVLPEGYENVVLSYRNSELGRKTMVLPAIPRQSTEIILEEPCFPTLKLTGGPKNESYGRWSIGRAKKGIGSEAGDRISSIEIAKGHKKLDPVQPGKYYLILTAHSMTYFVKEFEFKSGKQVIEVNLPEFYSLTIDQNHLTIWHAPILTYLENDSYTPYVNLKDGKATLSNLPAGRYKLSYTYTATDKHFRREQEFILDSNMTVILTP